MKRIRLVLATVAAGVMASCSCGSAPCGVSNCAGCCDSHGQCKGGTTIDACGSGAQACQTCVPNQNCLAAQCITPGGNNGDGGNNGGGDGGSGGGDGGNFSGTYDQYCARVANDLCSNAAQCKGLDPAHLSDCLAYIQQLLCGGALADSSLSKGYSTFNSAQAQACLGSFQSGSCSVNLALACGQVLSAHQTLGQPCNYNADCIGPNQGCGGATCPATCQPDGALGLPCLGTTCNTGLFCDFTTDTCQTPRPTGSPCDGFVQGECDASSWCNASPRLCTARIAGGQACSASGVDNPCVSGFFCSASTSTCQAVAATNASCTSSVGCVSGDFCDFNAAPPVCKPQVAQGVACTPFAQGECQPGLICFASTQTCSPPVGSGGTCNGINDCQVGLACDSISRTCGANTFTQPAGASCTQTDGCLAGLNCVGFQVNPDGGVGTPGVCHQPTLGDPCTFPDGCPPGTTCTVSGGTTSGTCVTTSLGAKCLNDWNCPPGTFCGGGVCLASANPGQACTQGSEASCTGADLCYAVSDAGSTCQPARGNGAACSTLDQTPCIFPYACLNGVCTASGGQGEPCFGGGFFNFCFGGQCELDAGTCGPLANNGQACLQGYECGSSDCKDHQCVAICP